MSRISQRVNGCGSINTSDPAGNTSDPAGWPAFWPTGTRLRMGLAELVDVLLGFGSGSATADFIDSPIRNAGLSIFASICLNCRKHIHSHRALICEQQIISSNFTKTGENFVKFPLVSVYSRTNRTEVTGCPSE